MEAVLRSLMSMDLYPMDLDITSSNTIVLDYSLHIPISFEDSHITGICTYNSILQVYVRIIAYLVIYSNN